MTVSELMRKAQELSPVERKELIKLLVDSLDMEMITPARRRRLSELHGLGREVWNDLDPQDYVNQLHDEWAIRS
jgi:hypothetical protein